MASLLLWLPHIYVFRPRSRPMRVGYKGFYCIGQRKCCWWDELLCQVMQKLNSKTNAAGWLPSSGNRTAQAFSQPGKGVPQLQGNVRLSTSTMNLNSQVNKQGKPHMYVYFFKSLRYCGVSVRMMWTNTKQVLWKYQNWWCIIYYYNYLFKMQTTLFK